MHSVVEYHSKKVESLSMAVKDISHDMDHVQERVEEVLSEATQHNQLVDELQEAQRRTDAALVRLTGRFGVL